MRWCGVATIFLLAPLFFAGDITGCGPGRGAGRRRGSRKLTPLVFKQHVPNVPEQTLTASGLTEGPVSRNDSRFRDLEVNYSNDVTFKDEEGTGADRLMTMRCKEKLNTLGISVMNQWPGVKLVVIEGWDEENQHSPDSLHYEGRAVDIITSDRERAKLGMLARLAIEAGFDWVYYESKSHIHCSVKSESSQAAKYGGCFTGDSTVLTSTGRRKSLSELKIGEHILAQDPDTKKLVFSEVIVFLDYDPNVKREFLKLTLKSGRTLIVTPNHLVPVVSTSDSSGEQQRTVYVDKLQIGDKLLVISNDTRLIVEDSIMLITPILRTGVFSPLTQVGTVVVNGVVASCYASVDNQYLAHWAFVPVRLLWNFQLSIQRLWRIINQPLNGWQTTEYSTRTIKSPSIGVYWYAKLLYATANYFIPIHLHN